MSVSRRIFLQTSLATGVLAPALMTTSAQAQSALAAELMAPGPLPDRVLGKADAPITVVEYASMTCPHCQHFHETVLPHLKTNYIDTGKVKLVFREFPLDPLAAGVSMLARCAPETSYFDVVGLFYQTQGTWARSDKPVDAILQVAKQVGFTQDSFKQCLTDQKLLDAITSSRTRASDKFQVNATPTFFVNGKKAEDFYSVEGVDKTLKPLT